MEKTVHVSFEEGAIEQYADAVNQVIKHKTKRYMNVTKMDFVTPEGTPMRIRVTIVAEPNVFGETLYPPEECHIKTSAVEQIKSLEVIREYETPEAEL
jgi:hypothetical protein